MIITVTISLYSEPVPDPDTKIIPVVVSFVASTVVVSASADATVVVSVFVVKVVDESVVLGVVVVDGPKIICIYIVLVNINSL